MVAIGDSAGRNACCSYLHRALRRRGALPSSDAAARSTGRSLPRMTLVPDGHAEGRDHGLARPHETGAGPPGSDAAAADSGAFDQKNNRVREQARLRGARGPAQPRQTVALTFLELPDDLEPGMPCLGQFDRGVRKIAAALVLGDEFRDPTDIAIKLADRIARACGFDVSPNLVGLPPFAAQILDE